MAGNADYMLKCFSFYLALVVEIADFPDFREKFDYDDPGRDS